MKERAKIERLRAAMREACDLLAERTHGSTARSPGHNARLALEAALGHEAEITPLETPLWEALGTKGDRTGRNSKGGPS